MTNYLYNGIELPDINEVWTKINKEHWRYASIFMSSSTRASLYFTQGPCRISSGNSERVDIPGGYHYSYWNGGTWSDPTSYDEPFTSDNAKDAVWANFDILNTDGSIYLAASDPVPVIETEWKKQDAYKLNTEWKGKTFYRMMGGKWVKQDAVKMTVVEDEPEKPASYLTFASAEPFTIGVNNATKNWDGTLYYSTDTTTWSEWDGTVAIASAEHDGEQRVYMRGSGNTKITGEHRDEEDVLVEIPWLLTGNNIKCNGNIENLLDFETVSKGKHPTMADYCYYSMFFMCTALTSAPELPATTLADNCYNLMFFGCASLTVAPELLATTLADSCYQNMFNSCTSLTAAPELPATILADKCYRYMFHNCTSLTAAPKLPATTLADYCYHCMFLSCKSLASVPTLPATTLAAYCYDNMFRECTSIKLSKTQSTDCPNAYRIPTSGTGTTASSALINMFYNTGGTFTGTPSINTTYYTSNTVV
jgi:hypothetical protein